jgi:uncharacterized membrane protein
MLKTKTLITLFWILAVFNLIISFIKDPILEVFVESKSINNMFKIIHASNTIILIVLLYIVFRRMQKKDNKKDSDD